MLFNNHRKLKNFLLKPGSQLQYGLYIFITLIIAVGYLQVHLMGVVVETITSYAIKMNFEPGIMMELEKNLNWAWFLSIAGIIAIFVLSVGIGIFVSHRFLGPAVRIKALIAALNAGNYSAREKLRRNDEFKDIIDGLNSLAADLEKRSASPSKKDTAH